MENLTPLPDKSKWLLALKLRTFLGLPVGLGLAMSPEAKSKLTKAIRFPAKPTFDRLQKSRSIKGTQLWKEYTVGAVMGKFEEYDSRKFSNRRLPYGADGVNVFAVPEVNGQRRRITEPIINAVMNQKTTLNAPYSSRLATRQSLGYAKYMTQIDFEAFDDWIPIPIHISDNFGNIRKHRYYRLRMLHTGAIWCVTVGHSPLHLRSWIPRPP